MRNTFIFKLFLTLCTINLICQLSQSAEAEILKLNLSGRGVSGPYFPTTSTIASIINQNHKNHGIRITVRSRSDSVSIIKAVIAGKLDFGVARQYHIYQACRGLVDWKGNPQTRLRSVLNPHAELVALVASVDSGIRNIQDLKNRRVFIGGPSSDLQHTVIEILNVSGINPGSDLTVTGMVEEEAPEMLQDREIDAFFYIMGVTNRAFFDLVSGTQQVILVPINGPGIERLVATNPFYVKSTVSTEHLPYFENESSVQVFGIKLGMITSTDLARQTVYIIVREIFENVDKFKNQHPATTFLTPKEMTIGMIAPVHPGAARFYRQSRIDYSAVTP